MPWKSKGLTAEKTVTPNNGFSPTVKCCINSNFINKKQEKQLLVLPV